MGTQEIIDKISKVRENNNKCWMQLLRISFKYTPEEAKKIFQQITDNDAEINKLSKELCK